MLMLRLLLSLCLMGSIAQTYTLVQETIAPFPKVLWTYWDKGQEGMRLFTRLCVCNMAHYARLSGWEFHLVTEANLADYVSQQGLERMQRMWDSSKHHLTPQNRADLIRLFLLTQKGGMWLDTNSFLLGKLSWIQHIDESPFVYNRPSEVATPEIITFTYDSIFGGNHTTVRDMKGDDLLLFPGVEIWSFIVMPNCRFLRDTLNHLEYSLAVERDRLNQETKQKGILFGRQAIPYFFTGTYQFENVLQKKQKQLDKTPSGQLRTAVGFYKMWSLRAQDTAMGIFARMNWFVFPTLHALFTRSAQELSDTYNIAQYMIKFNGGNYPHINNALLYGQFIECMGVPVRMGKDSLLGKYLLEPGANKTEVKQYWEALERGQGGDCSLMDQKVEEFKSWIMGWVYLALVLFVVVNCLALWAVGYMARRKQDQQDIAE